MVCERNKVCSIDEEHDGIKSTRNDTCHYDQWPQFCVECMVGNDTVDHATAIGLMCEWVLKNWQHAFDVYGISGGNPIDQEKTRLRCTHIRLEADVAPCGV